jgi:prepilin-type N-terminal cleavage/methylation domain-containing protein
MKSRGYSLVEMVVVIGIVSILLGIGTLKFNDYMVRYRVDAQNRMIYAELLQARADAVFQRRGTLVKLYTDHFETYSTLADGDSGAAPIRNQVLDFPITWNNGNDVKFDVRGVASVRGSVCVDAGDGNSATDSIVISSTRLNLGRKDKGAKCDADYITVK